MPSQSPDAGKHQPPGPHGLSEPASRPALLVTLSEEVVGDWWEESGFSEEHLVFAVVELTPQEEKHAMGLAPPGQVLAGIQEMVNASVYAIGGRKTTYLEREKWLKAIGPRGRKIVDSAFNKKNGLENDVGESVLAAAVPGRV